MSSTPISYAELEPYYERVEHELQLSAQEILDAAGAEIVHHAQGNDHLLGGRRMGADADSSVVDVNCRTWDHPNLFICDGSVFVTPGGAQPGQTIMALATRLADHLLTGAAGRLATAGTET